MSDNNNTNNTLDDDHDLSLRPNGKIIAEARADAEIADWIYAQSRILIRSKGGLMETREAVEKVLKDPNLRDKLLAHMALHDSESYNFYQRWKADEKKALAWLHAQISEMESPY